MNVCVQVDPLTGAESEETIRSAISFSSVLPPPGYDYTGGTPDGIEMAEKAQLSSALGWLDPRGLFGYSETSEYKDLYVYFDYGDRTSPVNYMATNAFKMYGLDGAAVNGPPEWGYIRGPAIIVRLEPDTLLSPNQVYNPMFTLEEIYRTLVFFRDTSDAEGSVVKNIAYKIAKMRDGVRSFKTQHENLSDASDGFTYLGPTGRLRTLKRIRHDIMDTCASCGKAQFIVGSLKQCSACREILYCGKKCQKIDWKAHKKACKAH